MWCGSMLSFVHAVSSSSVTSCTEQYALTWKEAVLGTLPSSLMFFSLLSNMRGSAYIDCMFSALSYTL